jgi:hypothetical protein
MSSALICNMATHVHDFRDDLELSIYVLLWVTLMYSDPSNRDAVGAFLVNVLDPQPIGGTGGFSKADFLQGQTFLKHVNFPGRPMLYKLISELAQLFAVRYETVPTDKKGLWLSNADCMRTHLLSFGICITPIRSTLLTAANHNYGTIQRQSLSSFNISSFHCVHRPPLSCITVEELSPSITDPVPSLYPYAS